MDISTEIAAIQAASEGAELRQPLINALNALNNGGTLPSVTTSDIGKILKVGANGWEVGEKSGYMPVPTATKQIIENGTYDVTDYASAVVNVSGGGTPISLSDFVNWINENGFFSANWILVPYYTSATNPSGYILSYSNQHASTTPAWALFNSTVQPVTNEGTGYVRWTASQSMPQWVQIELPTAEKINSFYIATCYFTNGNMCKSFIVQGSNDGTTFTDLYNGSLENNAIGKFIALPNESDAYKYYRIVVTDSYYSGYCGLASFFPAYIDMPW